MQQSALEEVKLYQADVEFPLSKKPLRSSHIQRVSKSRQTRSSFRLLMQN